MQDVLYASSNALFASPEAAERYRSRLEKQSFSNVRTLLTTILNAHHKEYFQHGKSSFIDPVEAQQLKESLQALNIDQSANRQLVIKVQDVLQKYQKFLRDEAGGADELLVGKVDNVSYEVKLSLDALERMLSQLPENNSASELVRLHRPRH